MLYFELHFQINKTNPGQSPFLPSLCPPIVAIDKKIQ